MEQIHKYCGHIEKSIRLNEAKMKNRQAKKLIKSRKESQKAFTKTSSRAKKNNLKRLVAQETFESEDSCSRITEVLESSRMRQKGISYAYSIYLENQLIIPVNPDDWGILEEPLLHLGKYQPAQEETAHIPSLDAPISEAKNSDLSHLFASNKSDASPQSESGPTNEIQPEPTIKNEVVAEPEPESMETSSEVKHPDFSHLFESNNSEEISDSKPSPSTEEDRSFSQRNPQSDKEKAGGLIGFLSRIFKS